MTAYQGVRQLIVKTRCKACKFHGVGTLQVARPVCALSESQMHAGPNQIPAPGGC
jgi:hypothetical protein